VDANAVAWLALGVSVLGGVSSVAGTIILFSFKRGQTDGQTEADFVKRGELHEFRREVETRFALRSETQQAIEGLKALTNQRIDSLEIRIDDLRDEVRSGVAQILNHITTG
jgi:hypothetical protein